MKLSRLAIFLLIAVPCIFMFAFFVLPVAITTSASFISDETGALTLATYREILSSEYHLSVLWMTMRISIIVTLVTIPLGYLIAYYTVLVLQNRTARRLVYVAVILPLFTSNIVRAFGFMVILGRTGFVNETLLWLGIVERPVRFLFSDLGVIIGLSYVFVPFMVLSIAGALQNIDRSQIQASGDLGAGPFATFWRVVLPLSLPGVLAGSIIVFTLSVSAYVTPSVMLGGRGAVMSMLIYEQYVSFFNFSFGAALAATLMFTALIIILFYIYVFERKLAWNRL